MDVFLLSIVISTNKTEAAVQDTNEGTLNVQWEDENFGESICNALKKEEVTYADIEGITGISIDSQYVVKLPHCPQNLRHLFHIANIFLFYPFSHSPPLNFCNFNFTILFSFF